MIPRGPTIAVVFCIAGLMSSGWCAAADIVEFLSGAKAEGTVKAIRKADKEFDIEIKIGTRTLVRTYSFDKVRAVTMKGKRFVLTPFSDEPNVSGASGIRTRSQVLQLIDKVGRTPPDWFAATPLTYPKSLDLSWPLKPPGKGWNNQKNIGQYMWDVINPNPGRWRSGVRLVHHEMTLHEKDPVLLQRDMKTLGTMYFQLFQDYPRAAFWFHQARIGKGEMNSVLLGECYWRMGNRKMGLDMLASNRLPLQAVKLYGDMGETDKAQRLAEAFAKIGKPHEAYLLAGDACRAAGRLSRAIDYYQKVLDVKDAQNKDHGIRYHGRARDSIEAIKLFDQANVARVADGTYRASSMAYVGSLEVEVRVANGQMTAVKVIKHREKQFYAALTDTPRQVLEKQSVQGIDATSRATITSQAIVNATAKALAKGSP
ncbi:MAG: FMN-binding protein [Pirellulaceae bacterium]|nr:FMN-binding protein [Pirellulaceae bacterium]HJN09851.1 FMN-binding protein [Pirellulaceae bacterium]